MTDDDFEEMTPATGNLAPGESYDLKEFTSDENTNRGMPENKLEMDDLAMSRASGIKFRRHYVFRATHPIGSHAMHAYTGFILEHFQAAVRERGYEPDFDSSGFKMQIDPHAKDKLGQPWGFNMKIRASATKSAAIIVSTTKH